MNLIAIFLLAFLIKPTPVWSTTETDFIRQYEPAEREFQVFEVADRLVYFHQRKIGEIIVEKDFINYQFAKNSRQLIKKTARWRHDLAEKPPFLKVSQLEAESKTEGEVKFSRLYLISLESDVFPLKPTPQNPCWIVRSKVGEEEVVTIIDAVTGEKLGYGIPPPSSGLSFSGPCDCRYNCEIVWTTWYQNAQDWFQLLGYPTKAGQCLSKEGVKAALKDPETTLFYEIAHGDSASFRNNCQERIYATDIGDWLANREKMSFAFLGNCGAMCETNENTLSYKLRKGSNQDSSVVGYCGMMDAGCEPCMVYSFLWQRAMFSYLYLGDSVKTAFEKAMADYPMCAANNCLRFAGDTNYQIEPLVHPLRALLRRYHQINVEPDLYLDGKINGLDFAAVIP